MRTVTLPSKGAVQNSSSGRSMLESWFPQWMGWYSTPASEETASETPEANQLEGEILQVFSWMIQRNMSTVFLGIS